MVSHIVQMPQGDFLNFSSTAWATGLSFILGYFVFVGIWLPRLGTTLAARAWITRAIPSAGTTTPVKTSVVDFARFTAAAVLVAPSAGVWPEVFLFGVEFAGLLLVVSTLSVPRETYRIVPVSRSTREEVTPVGATHAVSNLLGLWAIHRGAIGTFGVVRVHEVTTRAAAVAVPALPAVLPRLKMAVEANRID